MTEATADQAPAQSVEDRIAAQFGITDDQPAEAPPEEVEASTPEEPDEVEVEYEGEVFRLPKKLEKAIMQERDYTQKSQALAEQRRQVEFAHKALEESNLEREFVNSVAQEFQQAQVIDNYLQQLKTVDVNSLPMEDGFKHWMQMQQLKEQRDALQQSIEGKRKSFDESVKQRRESLKAQARDLLSKQIKGFSDEVANQMREHAKVLGYTEADWDQIQLDPRAATVIYKAMRFDELQSKPVAQSLPVVKPGSSNPMPQATRDKLAYHKAMKSAKTSQEKAKLIEQRLAGMF